MHTELKDDDPLAEFWSTLGLLADEFRVWGSLPLLDDAILRAQTDVTGFGAISLAMTLGNCRSQIKQRYELRHLLEVVDHSIVVLNALHADLSVAHGPVATPPVQASAGVRMATPVRR